MERLPVMQNKTPPTGLGRRIGGSGLLVLGAIALVWNLVTQSQDVRAAATGTGPHRLLVLSVVFGTVLTVAAVVLTAQRSLMFGKGQRPSEVAFAGMLTTFALMVLLSFVHPNWEAPGVGYFFLLMAGHRLLNPDQKSPDSADHKVPS